MKEKASISGCLDISHLLNVDLILFVIRLAKVDIDHHNFTEFLCTIARLGILYLSLMMHYTTIYKWKLKTLQPLSIYL
jgi:hypothetical protein